MRQTILAVLSLSAMAALLTGCGGDMVLLNSKGPVAEGQSNLMMTAIYLMLLVVIPSVIMALWFGWKYRASNKDADKNYRFITVVAGSSDSFIFSKTGSI
jgi:cytochrome o ubiquinol oxidase subunit 2